MKQATIKNNKIENIWDNIVYARKSNRYLLKLYYLLFWKGYLKDENINKPALVVQYFWKLAEIFNKENFDKSIAIFLFVNATPPMAKPIIKSTKQKYS